MEALVARILSDSVLALDVGNDKNVKPGMQFEIWESGEEIIHPETKESLGNLEIIKGRVEVFNVMPKMCLAKSVRHTVTKTKTVFPFDNLIMPFAPRRESYEVDVIEKMKVDKTNSDYEQRLVVKVGDRARLVIS